MPEFIERLNQYGPWFLLFLGMVGMLLQTVVYALYMRLGKRLLNSLSVSTAAERLPQVYRPMFDWAIRSIDAPYMRWLGIIQAVAMIVGGAVWLSCR